METYEYTKSPVNIDSLMLEISEESVITTEVGYASFNEPDDLQINFMESLDPAEKTALDNLVSAHTGDPIYDPQGYFLTTLGDGTAYFLPFTVTSGEGGVQIMLTDGSHGFTNTVSGVYPIGEYDIAIKKYVDDMIRGISGGDYWYNESLTATFTSSDTFQDKIVLSASGIDPGTYRLIYSSEYNADQYNKNVYVRVYRDNTGETIGESFYQTNNNANWFSFSGFELLTVSSGVETEIMRMQYRAGTANCGMRNARLELRRVS